MTLIKGYRNSNGDLRIPVDKEKRFRNDIELGTVIEYKDRIYLKSYGRVIDLERKYEYETDDLIVWGTDNSPFPGTIKVSRVTNKDTGKKYLKFFMVSADGKSLELRFSDKKACDIAKDIHNFFKYDNNPPDISTVPQISSESKIYMLLLTSPNYTITTDDLVKSGLKYDNALKMVQSMEKRNLLYVSGKKGNRKTYT